jgi:ubiquinone/menaquinone biosynthesis C-methylase UbiE
MSAFLEQSYSDVYKDENLGNIELNLSGWPRDRYEASIFFAGTGQRVLDVGCGNSIVLFNLKNRFKELYGTELSRERVLTSQKSLAGLNATIILNNIEEGTNFEDEYFDCVICSDVIEHIVDVFAGIREMTRILKKNGSLILNTPNIANLKARIKLLMGKFPSTSAPNEGIDTRTELELFDGGHLHYFTFSMLEKLLKRFGYSKVDRYGFGKLGKIHNLYPSLLSPSCQIVAIK